MMIATVIQSQHGELAPGMRGIVRGEHAGGHVVEFTGLKNTITGLRYDSHCWLAPEECTITDEPALTPPPFVDAVTAVTNFTNPEKQ